MDIKENVVADFKTSLDVTWKELRFAHDAITTGEIPLKLDTSGIPPAASPSAGWDSVSTSIADSEQERRPSTQTSSARSLLHPEGSEKGLTDGWQPRDASEEKEGYDLGAAYLGQSANNYIASAATTLLDWRSPFTDPMSIDIEQASTMILNSDDSSSPNMKARPRSTTEPPTFTKTRNVAPPGRVDTHSLGLATALMNIDADQEDSGTARHPSSTLSEPLRSEISMIRGLQHERISSHGASALDQMPALLASNTGHLSPNTVSSKLHRRRRSQSGSFNTWTMEPAYNEEVVDDTDTRRSAEGVRKELSVVIESDLADAAEFEPVSNRSEGSSTMMPVSTVQSTPPPPTRKPPVPPSKDKKPPKIPKRSSTYRVVNLTQPDDSSSSEDDLYSSSKPTSPVTQRQDSRSHFVEFRNSHPLANHSPTGASMSTDEAFTTGNPISESVADAKIIPLVRDGERLGSTSNHRSASQSGFVSKLSVPNLSMHRYSASHSPPLKRHATSAAGPERSGPSTSSNTLKIHQSPIPLERATTAATHHRSASSNARLASTIPTFTTSSTTPNTRVSTARKDGLSDGRTTMIEKEMAPAAGLEARWRSNLNAPTDKEMVALSGLEITQRSNLMAPIDKEVNADPAVPGRNTSVLTHASKDDPEPTATLQRSVSGIEVRNPEWYTPSYDVAETADLTTERINHIVHFWNNGAWDQAGAYLKAYLEVLVEQNDLARIRRARHLLGVCASFKGHWAAAIPHFLSVLQTPISDESDIDDGDCAAGYWLGDTYSMLNQRTEALLAYCVAERSSMFRDIRAPRIVECVVAEQEAVQLGGSRAEVAARWAKETASDTAGDAQSVLDPSAISRAVARSLLEYEPRRTRRTSFNSGNGQPFQLDPNRARCNSFTTLDRAPQAGKYYRLKLTPGHFEPDSPWPVMYGE